MALRWSALSSTELLFEIVSPSELVSAVETAVEGYCVDGWCKWVLQGFEGQSEPAG